MIIQSKYVDNSKSEQEFFSIVSDMRNIPALLPEQAINVQANEDNLSFTVQGMGSIALRVSQRVTYSLVQLVPVGKTPFPFVLSIKIAGLGNNCRVMYEIDAELNPLMAMMAKRPLQNLVDMMADVPADKVRKRVWIDSQTEEEIKRGIDTAKTWDAYDNLSEAAFLRAKEDYLMGINFSRALTIKYGYSVRSFLKLHEIPLRNPDLPLKPLCKRVFP